MAEPAWLIEEGIGETRAIRVEGGAIVEALIELPSALRAGAVLPARLIDVIAARRVGRVAFDHGGDAILQPLPPDVTQGATLLVEITREAIGHKRAVARAASKQKVVQPGPDLAARLGAGGRVQRCLPHHEDRFEPAGWSELLDTASTGHIDFPGGALLMSVTPAMTLFDVDGTLPPDELAVAGAAAAGRAIRRLEIAGSIGIDLPTVGDRVRRQAAASALDAVLPQPFERTAVNGFGFLQVVRPQRRASLPQAIAADRAGAGLRALLRRAERTRGHGVRTIVAHPALIARARAETGWIDALARRTGSAVSLQADPAAAIFTGHVHVEHP